MDVQVSLAVGLVVMSLSEASCHWDTWCTCPPPYSIATVVNSLQNRVKSIILCITLNATTGKIVFVTPDLQQSGTTVKYVATRPSSLPSLMFHFLKSSWRSLILYTGEIFLAWNSCTKYRLAFGLRPGPLRELKRNKDTYTSKGGKVGSRGEGKGREERGKGD